MTATVNGLRSPAILATLTLALAAWSCGPPAPTPVFVASAKALGVSTQHCSGASGALTLAEVMGAGGALLDYDSDGDLDLYVVQSGRLDGTAQGCPTEQLQDRLYRNDLSPDAPQRFVDVTRDSGIVASTYGMGAAVGDYDRDGHPDVYVTALGANLLWRNGGDGTFEEVAAAAGVQDDRWSVPAAFVDFDRDGWLDLWVGNYADFRVASRKRCFGPSGGADYCGPLAYNAEPDRLFRNTHDGRFEDVTLRSGLRAAFGYALGVGVGDDAAQRPLDGVRDQWDLRVREEAEQPRAGSDPDLTGPRHHRACSHCDVARGFTLPTTGRMSGTGRVESRA